MRTEHGDLAIRFTLTARECRAGMRRQVLQRWTGRTVIVGGAVFLLAGLAIGMTWLAGFGILFLAFVGLVVAFGHKLDPETLRKVHTIAVNPSGVYLSDGVVEARTPWSVFTRFDETTELFLLTLRFDGAVAVVPKRAFDGAAEVDRFCDLARAGVAG